MGNNMRAERARRGLTQAELADALGVVAMSVVRWESGASEPDTRNLIRMSRLYGCTPEYLLDLVDEPHKELDSTLI